MTYPFEGKFKYKKYKVFVDSGENDSRAKLRAELVDLAGEKPIQELEASLSAK